MHDEGSCMYTRWIDNLWVELIFHDLPHIKTACDNKLPGMTELYQIRFIDSNTVLNSSVLAISNITRNKKKHTGSLGAEARYVETGRRLA